jgi:hypothetical protein
VKIIENTWRPPQVQAMTGLAYDQVAELVARVEDYLGGWQPTCGRPREMELFDAVTATLFYYRHNLSQDVTAAVFGVSQATISRVINAVEEPIAAVLDCEVPELAEAIDGRVVITDGTLLPTGNRAGQRELYSGKRRRSGAAIEVLCHLDGRLAHVGDPMVGSTHDLTAFRASGLADALAEHMTNNMVFGDLGYLGEPVVMPVKTPKNGDLSPAQKAANKHFSGLRAAVERCIAHLKNWKIIATGYRRPLQKLAICLLAVTGLEFYRLNWQGFE